MHWGQQVDYAVVSDIGFRRCNNQDSYALHLAPNAEYWEQRGHLFLVADGMGGHAVGELASKIAADTVPHTYDKLRDLPPEAALPAAVQAAHQAIHERGEQNRDFARMGTTCSALLLTSRGATCAHIGDSRIYRIRGTRIDQLTFDHSLQWELLKQGRMSPEEIYRTEPRNVLTRSLGPEPKVQIDVEGPYPVRPGDVYLLCSDGLTTLVSDEEIGILARELPPAEACQALVDLANLRGGSDNITVLVARVGDLPPGVPEAPPEPEESSMGWGWLVAFASAGIAFVAGNALIAFEKPVQGIALEGLAVLGIGALVLAWLRRKRRLNLKSLLPELTPGTPYRTATAAATPEFVNALAALENDLQRNALEEGWTIDWSAHNRHFARARQALAQNNLREALREYAQTIHVLMGGIHLQRKLRDQAARWGAKKPLRPETGPATSP